MEWEGELEYYRSIIELICSDFCYWMYGNKLTAVKVGMKKKYELVRKDMINVREVAVNTFGEYSQPTNVEVDGEVGIKANVSK
jgi:hypothetical protein